MIIYNNSISIESIKQLRKYADNAESEKMLHECQLKYIYENNYFKLFVPTEYGGLALPLIEAVKLQEALAYADGSIGWTVTLCGGAGWFSGFLSSEILADFLIDEKMCFAGSGKAIGTAEKTKNGYLINGEWGYSTGAKHATAFTANCIITKNGLPILDNSGDKLIQSFIFRKEEVHIIENWQSSGMIATGSHGFSVDNISVENNRSFLVKGELAKLPHMVYQYPFLQLAECTLAANLSGIGLHFLDECQQIICERIETESIPTSAAGIVKTLLASERVKLNECRSIFFESIERSFLECKTGNGIATASLTKVSAASRNVALQARLTAESLYPHCGIGATIFNTVINRAWRDLHTAGHHSLMLYER